MFARPAPRPSARPEPKPDDIPYPLYAAPVYPVSRPNRAFTLGKVVLFSIAITTLGFLIWVVLSSDWESWNDKPRQVQLKELGDVVGEAVKKDEDDGDGDVYAVRTLRREERGMAPVDRQLLGVGKALLGHMFPRGMKVFKELIPEIEGAAPMKKTLEEEFGEAVP